MVLRFAVMFPVLRLDPFTLVLSREMLDAVSAHRVHRISRETEWRRTASTD